LGEVELGGAAVQIAVGFSHTCALLDDGTLRCWGSGELGALGYGNTDWVGDDETPEDAGPVDVGGDVVGVSANFGHTCAVLDGGSVRCWGANFSGQLGYGHTETIGDDEAPAAAAHVDVGDTVEAIACGVQHTCAVLTGGAVKCWGLGGYGGLGYADDESIGDDETPASVGTVDVGGTVTGLELGDFHTCARLDDSAVRCWGWSWYQQLGHAGLLGDIGDDEPPSAAGDVPLF
jgi:alpha-tubulin suppressor-like RCC1 family protein